MALKNQKYILQSIHSKKEYDDEGWTLDPINEDTPSLIRAIYKKKQLTVGSDSEGLYKFNDWLPTHRKLKGSQAPITYKSEGLAKHLKLDNLYITFSGYWPEKNIEMSSCSFKETEAYSVVARLPLEEKRVLVVASAGNTARAFAKVCSDNDIPLLLCIPEDNLNALWFNNKIKDNVKVIATKSGSDYFDAIHIGNIICEMPEFIAEGGAKNVARRDGMGTTTLSAVTHIGKIPDFYFQAIGSGTGAIAALEANLRLIEDGHFGTNKMKLILSQNKPFQPIYDAWKNKSNEIKILDDNLARKQVEEITAKVLSNRKPPYSIAGGLYDALKETNGDIIIVDNKELETASELFLKTEGIDIHPAAGVAVASLIKSINTNVVNNKSIIMLNITGGGEEKFKSENELQYLKPDLIFSRETSKEVIHESLCKLFNF